MTDKLNRSTTPRPRRGTIFYDGECTLCTAGARRWATTLARRGFALLPLQTSGAAERLGVDPDRLLDEVRLLTADGRSLGNVDAILYIARRVWWAWPLWLLSCVPGVTTALRYVYRRAVPYRYCVTGRCGRPTPFTTTAHAIITWSPVILIPAVAFLIGWRLPAWAFMWVMAAAIFYGCKWLSWRQASSELRRNRPRSLGYLIAWPGMDATSFLDRSRTSHAPAPRRWVLASVKILLGAALVWGVARFVLPHDARLAGWTGMIGLILLLHFGLFELIALAWRTAGIDARPIMDRAIASTSVGEFWGRRWNRGFSDLSRRFVFEPALPWIGAAGALLLTFVASGLIHELVITLPARGGWGGPTAYFLIQAAAMLLERSRAARRFGLGRGTPGWAFTALVTLAPLPFLFPPPFVDRVILPFMHAIGAFGGDDWRFSMDRADLIRLAGLLHFGILIASAMIPQVLDWRRELGKLAPITRHLVWVHGAFIVLTIVGLGAISLINANELAAGSMLARSFCAFVAVFWLIRLGLQFFLFDARPYLTSAFLKLGYHGLTVVFSILVLAYGWLAFAPAPRAL